MRAANLFLAVVALAVHLLASDALAQGPGGRASHAGRIPGGGSGAEFGRARSGGGGASDAGTIRGRGDIGETGGQRLPDSARPQGGQATHGRGGPGSSSASGLNHAARGGLNRTRGMERAASARATNSDASNLGAPNSDNARNSDKGQPLDNAQRIQEKQFEQAEHLREVGQANGNERLNNTADRMESNAQARYQRRVEGSEQTTGPAPQSLPPQATERDNALQNVPQRPTTPAQPRSSWLPSWLRGKSQ